MERAAADGNVLRGATLISGGELNGFRRLGLFVLASAFAVASIASGAGAAPSGQVLVRVKNWQARIDPQTLKVEALLPGRRPIEITRGLKQTYRITKLQSSAGSAGWEIPDLGLRVRMSVAGSHLRVQFRAAHQTQLTWPSSGGDAAMSALIYPEGEGLYIPLRAPFWLAHAPFDDCQEADGGLSMPFWSYRIRGGTITYLAVSELETKVCLAKSGGRISTYAVHDFRRRAGLPPYKIEIWLGGSSPVSPALEYRRWLIARGRYVTLQSKIAANPQVGKLLGAMQGYVFGTGRTTEFLRLLHRMGVSRMWIGYGQDPRSEKNLVNRAYIAQAEKLGYLIGPYDTFLNAQNPKTADDVASIWGNDLYPKGCIIRADGKIRKGFHDRGCYLSSEALAMAEPSQHNMAERVSRFARTGINSYFLDSDAAGDLYDDYSQRHPMTQAGDRANRLARLRYISQTRRLVLGSEGGAGWSAPAIDIAQGAEAVSSDFLWRLERQRKVFGGWWPAARPRVFFKPVQVDDVFATARYDPVYRLPLYQAVFHQSLISTDRWETPLLKFPELVRRRTLLELLYDVPSMWSLDLKELQQNQKTFSGLYKFFSPIHRAAGDLPLTQFDWLTANRLVQRTVFGGEIQMTANFGGMEFDSIPPHCIQARWLKQKRTELFCP